MLGYIPRVRALIWPDDDTIFARMRPPGVPPVPPLMMPKLSIVLLPVLPRMMPLTPPMLAVLTILPAAR